jgi:hypothetical protein
MKGSLVWRDVSFDLKQNKPTLYTFDTTWPCMINHHYLPELHLEVFQLKIQEKGVDKH